MKQLLCFIAVVASCCAQTTVTASGTMAVSGKITALNSGIIVVPADFFVAPQSGAHGSCSANGNDGNSGTDIAHPVASLDKARQKAQPLLGTKPLTVMLCGGTYYGSTTTFGGSDSGHDAVNTITYQNYPGDSPILDGGTQVTGWTGPTSAGLCSGISNCYQVSISNTAPYFEALYYNGVRRARPRTGASSGHTFDTQYGIYCNDGSNNSYHGTACLGSTSVSTARNNVQYTTGDPDMGSPGSWTNLSDVEMYDGEKWVWNILRGITSINASTHVVTFSCASTGNGPGVCPNSGGPGSWNPGNNYVFENVPQLFRFPKQWILDRSAGNLHNPNWTLYYIADVGENPNTDTVVIPNKAQVVTASSWSWWKFSGIQIQHDNLTLKAGGYESVQLDPYLNYTQASTQALQQGVFSCTNCSHATMQGNLVTQTTGSGIEFLGAASDCQVGGNCPSIFLATPTITIADNLVWDIGAYGIKVGSAPQNSESEATVPNNVLVINNGVTGSGRFLPTADDYMLGLTHHVEVAFNDGLYAYHDGIEVCKPNGGVCTGGGSSSGSHDNNIHDNRFGELMQGMTSDGGGIYVQTCKVCGANTDGTACSGTGSSPTNKNFMTHNMVWDVNDETAQSVNNSNWGSNGYGGHGLYMDSCTGNWDDEKNLIYRVQAVGFNMSNGPSSVGQPNIGKNNIVAFAQQAIAGVQACAPASSSSTINQFNFLDNIALMDKKPTGNSYNMQKSAGAFFFSGAGFPTSTQDWVNNFYYLTTNGGYCASGTCTGTVNPAFFQSTSTCTCGCTGKPACTSGNSVQYSCSKQAPFATAAAWQAIGQDLGSSWTTNPGFVNTTACTPANDPNWPFPDPGVCDDYRFGNGVGPNPAKFTAFSVVPATTNIPGNGFGRYSGAPLPTVIDTFLTATYPASHF